MKDITQKLQLQVNNLTNQIHYRDHKLLSFENGAHEMMMANIESRAQITIRDEVIAEQEQKIAKLEKRLQSLTVPPPPQGAEVLKKEIDRLNRVTRAMDAELALMNETNEELRGQIESQKVA